MIYFVVMSLVALLSPIYKRGLLLFQNISNSTIIRNQGKLIYFSFFTIILVCICGLRSIKIGLDTPQYYFLFHDVSKTGNLFKSLKEVNTEWGFVLYQYIISLFGNYYVFLFITAIITIVPVMWIIYKYSKIPWLSIVLFILFGYFTFYMSGLRQAIAMSFCIIAFHYSSQNKLIKYLICISIAFLFHQTAIIFLPIYWMKRIQLNKFVIAGTIVLIGLSFVLRGIIYNLLMSFSRIDYSGAEDAGGIRMFISMLFFIVLGFVMLEKIKKNEITRSLLYMMIIGAVLWPILSIGRAATFRLFYYFHIFIILYSANLAMSIKKIEYRNLVIVLFVLIGIAYFITQIMLKKLNVYPFDFFWEVPVNFNTLRHSWE